MHSQAVGTQKLYNFPYRPSDSARTQYEPPDELSLPNTYITV